jgi:hypothetical protein
LGSDPFKQPELGIVCFTALGWSMIQESPSRLVLRLGPSFIIQIRPRSCTPCSLGRLICSGLFKIGPQTNVYPTTLTQPYGALIHPWIFLMPDLGPNNVLEDIQFQCHIGIAFFFFFF